MASDEFDPVVRRRKSRDLRRSRDISDESSDRDTRRRSSTKTGRSSRYMRLGHAAMTVLR